MIKIRIKNADQETDIQFPISENAMYATLAEIHAAEAADKPHSVHVVDVDWPEEFSFLTGSMVNLDEMNYLGRRMESFDSLEYDQFLVGITKLDTPSPTVKDLINLTFNLDHFTLCQDVSNYGKIGRTYIMNTQGAVPANDEDDPKYAAIGKDLVERGLAQITERGLLIYNPFDPLTELYDGRTFPEYYYENAIVNIEASCNGRTELIQLPGEELAIKKAIARLGAPSENECEFTVEDNQIVHGDWEARIQGILQKEGIYAANKMLHALDVEDMDWDKLSASIELTGVQKASNIALLATHLDRFTFIPDAETESDIGHYLVDNVDEYVMNIELEDFFDFAAFGEHIAEEHEGEFVEGGFVYYDDEGYLYEFLERMEPEEEGISMGGM